MTAAHLPRSTPEAQGIPSGAIGAFLDAVAAAGLELHGFLLLRRGATIAEGYWEPYGPEHPHMQFSLCKSFTSMAVGLLVAEGRLSLDDRVVDLLPDEMPSAPSENLGAMRVRHLLTMTTGHGVNPTRAIRLAGPHWTRSFLAQPVEHAPGTRFVYNDVASYALSAIVQRITGQRLTEYLRPRLLDPLGVEQLTWRTSPEGIDLGGWDMSATTAEVARFGQLLLQEGHWHGEQLVPAAWVAAATAHQVPSAGIPGAEWAQGYGYQFWRCTHGAYRADGAFGQLCVVMPEQEAVLAMNAGAGLGAYGRLLELAWEYLAAAMGSRPLPADPAAELALADRLVGLRLAQAAGERTSPLADRGEQHIPCGHGLWERGEATAMLRTMFRAEPSEGDPPPAKVAASGAWSDERTYVVRLRWYETAFARTLTCRFGGDRVTIEQAQNVSFGPTARARLEGRAP